MGNVRLYLRYVGVSVRAQMQYRASVVLYALGQLLLTAIEFLAVWVLFDRFGTLKGWSLPEVALLYGMANVAFALAEGLARGFDVFDRHVKSGDFDRLLLRPRDTALQVAAGEVQLMRVGRLIQGGAVLVWAAASLGVAWTVPKLLLLGLSVLGGAATFVGLFVLQATLAFWTTEGLEVANVVTYGGLEAVQYPLDIYRLGFQRFFTFVIPLACLNYVPGLALLDRTGGSGLPAWVPWAAWLAGVVFLALALRAWRAGVRRYRSTGS